jgi:TPP-dependent pyruvate/acetoin dehydrogenase alpha subunit
MAAAAARNIEHSGARARKNISTKPAPVATKDVPVEAGPSFENPLVPNLVLRQMFQKIVEARLLESHLLGSKGKSKGERARQAVRQEACRVSLVQGLAEGDVVLDSQRGEVMQHLLGASLAEVLGTPSSRRPADQTAVRKGRQGATATVGTARLLPLIKQAEERLFAGVGIALMAKHLNRNDVTVLFVQQHDVSKGAWKRALTLAGTRELPIIFVILPTLRGGRIKSEAEISGLATRCGVPGVPVDASDAVALYRVAQESLGRIRAGGGAVLIEAVAFPAPGQKDVVLDPVEQMKAYLMHRRVSPVEWFAEIERSFQKLLASSAVG